MYDASEVTSSNFAWRGKTQRIEEIKEGMKQPPKEKGKLDAPSPPAVFSPRCWRCLTDRSFAHQVYPATMQMQSLEKSETSWMEKDLTEMEFHLSLHLWVPPPLFLDPSLVASGSLGWLPHRCTPGTGSLQNQKCWQENFFVAGITDGKTDKLRQTYSLAKNVTGDLKWEMMKVCSSLPLWISFALCKTTPTRFYLNFTDLLEKRILTFDFRYPSLVLHRWEDIPLSPLCSGSPVPTGL